MGLNSFGGMNPFKDKSGVMKQGMQMLDDNAGTQQAQNAPKQQAPVTNNLNNGFFKQGVQTQVNNAFGQGNANSASGINNMFAPNNALGTATQGMSMNNNPMNSGAMNNNPMNNNPMNSGALNNNPMNSGALNNNPMNSGALNNNPMNSGAMNNNPMNSGAMSNNPMNSGAMNNNPMNSGVMNNNPMNSGAMHNNPMNSGAMNNKPMNSGAVNNNPMNSDAMHNNPINSAGMNNNPMNSAGMNNNPMNSNQNNVIDNTQGNKKEQGKSLFKGFGAKPKKAEVVQDIDLDNIDTTASTSAYLQEQKKTGRAKVNVVQNIVEGSKYKAIMSKSITQFIVVTGDRKTGKTTTAFNIAEHFGSSKVNALYVDFDMATRGSLLALDVAEVSNYAPCVQNGLISVSNGLALSNCVFRSGLKPFDCLILMYGTQVTDDILRNVQSQIMSQAEQYNVVVIDCPLDKLYVLEDILHMSTVYCCMPCDEQGVLNTYFRLGALSGDDEPMITQHSLPISSKDLTYLYMRMLYVLQDNVKNDYASIAEYFSNLFSMASDAYDWSALKVAGMQSDIVQVLKALV